MSKLLDKRTAILDTALELIVEQGFHNTPMSQIAKQAGVSAGIIYHYFESKDDLIHELYHEIKAKITETVFTGDLEQVGGMELLRHIWLHFYRFYVAHPKETVFLEQYENSPFYKDWSENFDEKSAMLTNRIQQEIDDGKLVDLPMVVLYDLTMGVATSLAKQHIKGIIEPDDAMLEKIVDAVCRSVMPLEI